MGRPTKLDKPLQNRIVAALKTGAEIRDVCASLGLGKSTYYLWLEIGEAAAAGEPHARMPADEAERQAFVDFVDTVTRAQIDAKMTAIKTLNTATKPFVEKSKTVKTYTETRLRKGIDEKTGQVVDVPYEYKQTWVTDGTVRRQGDVRAAIEFLKRRFPDEWGDRLEVDWRRELEEAGLNPDDTLGALERQFEEHLRKGAARVDAGSAGAGAEEG